jgi:hypothetical protein
MYNLYHSISSVIGQVGDMLDRCPGYSGSRPNMCQADSDSNATRSKQRPLHFCHSCCAQGPRTERNFSLPLPALAESMMTCGISSDCSQYRAGLCISDDGPHQGRQTPSALAVVACDG